MPYWEEKRISSASCRVGRTGDEQSCYLCRLLGPVSRNWPDPILLADIDQPLTLISTGLSSSNLMWDSAGMVISFFPVAAAPAVPAPAPTAAPINAPLPPPARPPISAPAAPPPPMNSALCLACPFPDSPNVLVSTS